MDFLRGVIPGSIQGNEDRVGHGPEALQDAWLARGLISLVLHGEQRLRSDRIERLANGVVGGNVANLKKALRIVLSFGLLQGALKG